MDIDRVIAEYNLRHKTLVLAGQQLESLLHQLLESRSISVHFVGHRIKDVGSLRGKLMRKQIDNLNDIHDLVGLRIITYFAQDVSRVANLIEEQFRIDADNSVNKNSLLDPDRFGYRSVHYVASISSSRSSMPEYRHCRDVVFEIQLRSILQHAWAEIEHDLGYKVEAEVPRNIRRRFSRLSGLLEIADDEFLALKEALNSYQSDASSGISRGQLGISLDKDSVAAYISSSERLRKFDRALASALDLTYHENRDQMNDRSGEHARELSLVGFTSLAEVDAVLGEEILLPFAIDVFGTRIRNRRSNSSIQGVAPGAGLAYAFYFRVATLVESRGTAWADQLLTETRPHFRNQLNIVRKAFRVAQSR